MSSRADTQVGPRTARAHRTTRRGTPWQDRSPFALWPTATAATPVPSQGQHPAHTRHAILTREHQKGGAPTRSAPTRRGHPPRPPPRPDSPTRTLPAPLPDHPLPGGRVKGASRRYAISLRLTPDPPTRPRFRQRSMQGGDRPAQQTRRQPIGKPGTPPQCRTDT